MHNINDLYIKIKDEKNTGILDMLKELGVNLNTEFKIHSETYTTMTALLHHSDRKYFDIFYTDLKNSKKDWLLHEFFYKCFYSGIMDDRQNEEKEKITLNRAIFNSLRPWNIDVFNEIKNDCLSMFDSGLLKSGLIREREMIESNILDIDYLFKKSYYNSKRNYLDFIKKYHNEISIKKEKAITNEKNTNCVLWSLLYDNNDDDEFLKILDWAEESFGSKEEIIHSVHILQWPNSQIKLFINDIDINKISEEPFNALFPDYENQLDAVYTLKEFMELYINPDKNRFLNMTEDEVFRPEEKEKIRNIKEKALIFQKRLIFDGLDVSLINNNEVKKRL